MIQILVQIKFMMMMMMMMMIKFCSTSHQPIDDKTYLKNVSLRSTYREFWSREPLALFFSRAREKMLVVDVWSLAVIRRSLRALGPLTLSENLINALFLCFLIILASVATVIIFSNQPFQEIMLYVTS